jgi:hypothetical protein
MSKVQSSSKVLKVAREWDLSNVGEYVTYEHPELNQELIKEAEMEYRYFMILRATYNDYMEVPTKIVDYIWHAHILHTQDYINFSNEIAGKYIHHKPVLFTTENFEKNSTCLSSLAVEKFGENVFKFELQKHTPNAKFTCT